MMQYLQCLSCGISFPQNGNWETCSQTCSIEHYREMQHRKRLRRRARLDPENASEILSRPRVAAKRLSDEERKQYNIEYNKKYWAKQKLLRLENDQEYREKVEFREWLKANPEESKKIALAKKRERYRTEKPKTRDPESREKYNTKMREHYWENREKYLAKKKRLRLLDIAVRDLMNSSQKTETYCPISFVKKLGKTYDKWDFLRHHEPVSVIHPTWGNEEVTLELDFSISSIVLPVCYIEFPEMVPARPLSHPPRQRYSGEYSKEHSDKYRLNNPSRKTKANTDPEQWANMLEAVRIRRKNLSHEQRDRRNDRIRQKRREDPDGREMSNAKRTQRFCANRDALLARRREIEANRRAAVAAYRDLNLI